MSPWLNLIDHPPGVKDVEEADGNFQNHFSAKSIILPENYWLEASKAFEVRSGQTNEWTIPLPDVLLRAVREALKAEKLPTEKPPAKAAANKENG
jgi:hypothetical protein